MTAPRRVRLQRIGGWRLPENTVKVDRSSRWGNPFRIGQSLDARAAAAWGWHFDDTQLVTADGEAAVRRFGACLEADEAAQAEVRKALAGKNLACWCREGQPCHADVLLRVANGGRP